MWVFKTFAGGISSVTTRNRDGARYKRKVRYRAIVKSNSSRRADDGINVERAKRIVLCPCSSNAKVKERRALYSPYQTPTVAKTREM